MNSAGKIDQLNAFLFKMQSGKHNLSGAKAMKFRNAKCRVWQRDSERRNLHQIWGDARKIEIGSIEKNGAFAGISFSGIPDGGSLIEGGFFYTVEISRFTLVTPKQGNMLVEIEN